MDKKKRVRFSLDFDKIEELVDRMVESMAEKQAKKGKPKGPTIMGFSINLDSGNAPLLDEFSELDELEEMDLLDEKKVVKNSETFLVNTIKTSKEVIVTLQVPAEIRERELKIKPIENKVKIISNSRKNRFYKEIILDERINSNKFNWNLNNGVLEINLRKH
ncbi:Hsp20/alpha crystallin family protein [Candidatus Micrarchaeota archaeon]|nr:Hsp20/alpha crystallin family protein [Candidatus Micrarchaeota archaeon]